MIIVLIIGFLNDKKETEALKRDYDIPSTINVENNTKFENVEIISEIVLHKILYIDTINIIYYHMNKESGVDDEFKLYAFVDKNKFKENTYNIFLSKTIKQSMIKYVLIHELYHVYQYETKELILLNPTSVIYKGDTLDFTLLDYDDRPHENDAKKQTKVLGKKFNDVIYSK